MTATNQPKPRPRQSNTADLAALRAEFAAAMAMSDSRQADTHSKISALYAALMEPQPGYDHSLLQRMAAVTIAIESGDRTMRTVIQLAKIIGAIATIVAAAVAFVKWGGPPPSR